MHKTKDCLFVTQTTEMGEQGEQAHRLSTSSFLGALAPWLQNAVCSCYLRTKSPCSQISLLIFLVCECILHAPIHAEGHQKRLKAGTTVKHVNTPCLCSARSPRTCIPFVFQANLLHISQITMGFAAPPALPQIARWPRESWLLLGK